MPTTRMRIIIIAVKVPEAIIMSNPPITVTLGLSKRTAMAIFLLISFIILVSGSFAYQALAWPTRIMIHEVQKAVICIDEGARSGLARIM